MSYRIVIGKPGLDGHDRGLKYVAHILRDAGFETIYLGIRRTPEELVDTAIREHAQAIGVSLLSGAQNHCFARIMELLREREAERILVFGGGVIPPRDVEYLKQIGVAEVFTPGVRARQIVTTIQDTLNAASKVRAAQEALA